MVTTANQEQGKFNNIKFIQVLFTLTIVINISYSSKLFNFCFSPFESRFPINVGITGYVATTGEVGSL